MMLAQDVTARAVSLVVELIDPLRRDGRPIGDVRVRLRHPPERPVRNLSGYYVFADLPTPPSPPPPPPTSPINPYRIEITSALYLPELVTAPAPLPPPIPFPLLSAVFPPPPVPFPRNVPRVLVSLRPAVWYPFPATASLVRGMVRRGTTPLASVPVTVTVHDPTWLETLWTSYVTDTGGDFVFAFKVKKPGSPPPPVPPGRPALQVTLTSTYTPPPPPAPPPVLVGSVDILVVRNATQSTSIVI